MYLKGTKLSDGRIQDKDHIGPQRHKLSDGLKKMITFVTQIWVHTPEVRVNDPAHWKVFVFSLRHFVAGKVAYLIGFGHSFGPVLAVCILCLRSALVIVTLLKISTLFILRFKEGTKEELFGVIKLFLVSGLPVSGHAGEFKGKLMLAASQLWVKFGRALLLSISVMQFYMLTVKDHVIPLGYAQEVFFV